MKRSPITDYPGSLCLLAAKRRFLLATMLLFVYGCFSKDLKKPRQAIVSVKASEGYPNNYVKVVRLEQKLSLFIRGRSSRVFFELRIPKSLPHRQILKKIKYSSRPTLIFTKGGNRYAGYVRGRVRGRFELHFSMTLLLYRYSYKAILQAGKSKGYMEMIKKHYKSSKKSLKKYLAHERYIETNHPIIKKYAQRIKSGHDRFGTVNNIAAFVGRKLRYVVTIPRIGAVKALQKGEGDCTEFSDLTVALCRAKGIPSRVVAGYGRREHHNWIEVYDERYGWIPFEPQSKGVRFVDFGMSYIRFGTVEKGDLYDGLYLLVLRRRRGTWVTHKFRTRVIDITERYRKQTL